MKCCSYPLPVFSKNDLASRPVAIRLDVLYRKALKYLTETPPWISVRGDKARESAGVNSPISTRHSQCSFNIVNICTVERQLTTFVKNGQSEASKSGVGRLRFLQRALVVTCIQTDCPSPQRRLMPCHHFRPTVFISSEQENRSQETWRSQL